MTIIASNNETLTIVCRYTGIQARIELPRIGRLTLEYTHPLSHIDSALEASNRQDFLRRLDASVLAGIIITLLRHSKLLANSKDHAGAINAQLSKASRGHLIKSIELLRRHFVHLPKTGFLPKVKFDYYESQSEANRALEAVIGTLTAELLDQDSLTDQVKNYFRAHTRATTFDGYSRELALEKAMEADAIKREAKNAECNRKADAALVKAAKQRKAKEGMLTRRERAQKLKLIVQTDDHKLNASRIAVLRKATKQADLLPESQLTKLSTRVAELLEEHDDEPTCEVLLAAQAIFTHCLKSLAQSAFSVEEELMGLDTVHGKQEEVGPTLGDAQQAEYGEEELPKAEPKKESLLERIRAKKAAAANKTST